MEEHEVHYGITDGRKWICGHIPMKSDVILYIDSRTGTGINSVLSYTLDFIKYQARQMSIPSYAYEDLVQELTYIALIAIPDYSVEKGANMLTFLQNHIKNRMVNLYKFATERCRTATHGTYRYYKVRCPSCKNNMIFNETDGMLSHCKFCNHPTTEGRWKRYPVPIAMFSSDEELPSSDGNRVSLGDSVSQDVMIVLGHDAASNEDSMVSELSINSAISELDPVVQRIVTLFLSGKTVSEISEDTGMSQSEIRSKLGKLSGNTKLVKALGREL